MTNNKAVIYYLVSGIVVIGSLSTAFYFYSQYKMLSANSPAAVQEEAKRLVATVGRLIVLPADEQPTIATVADPEKLKSQPFFANAQKGDKVLIYMNAKKGILYSPAEDKIVEVAPITTGQPESAQPAASSTKSSATKK